MSVAGPQAEVDLHRVRGRAGVPQSIVDQRDLVTAVHADARSPGAPNPVAGYHHPVGLVAKERREHILTAPAPPWPPATRPPSPRAGSPASPLPPPPPQLHPP